MSGEDPGTAGRRLPGEQAPRPLPRFDGQKDTTRRAIIEREGQAVIGNEGPLLAFQEYRKTSTIYAVRMDEAYEVETLEGLHDGKPGSYLAVGIHGELYPIDAAVMAASYEPVTGTPSATIADVQAVAEKLELVYVPEQHRLHAAPREECNVDASMTKTRIPEARLASVSPDVKLCEHCVSPDEARIIRAGLRRT